MAIGRRAGKQGGTYADGAASVSYAVPDGVVAGDLLVVCVGMTKDGASDPLAAGDISIDGTATVGPCGSCGLAKTWCAWA